MPAVDRQGGVVHNRVFIDGVEVARDVAVTFPDIMMMTTEIQAMGTMTMPLPGLFESFELSITRDGIDKQYASMLAPKSHDIEIREAVSMYKADGTYGTVYIKTYAAGVPLNIPGGSSEIGSKRSPEIKYTLSKYQQYADGEELCNIDRLNQVFVVDGVDYMEDVRNQMQ